MEPAYDELAEIAGHVCEAPVALVSFVDRDRQWFKSAQGLPDRETPLDQSVCRYALRQPDVFIVPDLAQDVRFAHYGIVTQKHPLRFYAGAPLVTPDGYALGTLCVLDHRPRQLSPRAQELLSALARQVVRLLELHRANDRQGQMLAELDAAVAALVGRFLRGPRETYAEMKRLLNQSPDQSLDAQLQLEAEAFARCAARPDFDEGLNAFFAKRKPSFNG